MLQLTGFLPQRRISIQVHIPLGARLTQAAHPQPGFGGLKTGIRKSLRALQTELRQKVQQVSHAHDAVVDEVLIPYRINRFQSPDER